MLSQSVSGLSIGGQYLISFYLSNTASATCALNVTFGSTVLLSTSNAAVAAWTLFSQVVMATSASQILTFSAYNSPSYYYVSNVTAYAISSPPPPPSPAPPPSPPYSATLAPPVTGGLIGMYSADKWAGSIWFDTSGSGNHLTSFSGTVTTVQAGINGRTYISGTTATSLTWPSVILPPTYTLFHIAKYNNGVKGRIFQASNGNWLSGFWWGNAGVAHHNGWLANPVDNFGFNWVLSTDQNGLYR